MVFGMFGDARKLEQQRAALRECTESLVLLESRIADLPRLKIEFADVWSARDDPKALRKLAGQARQIVDLLARRAAVAKRELPVFDDTIDLLKRQLPLLHRDWRAFKGLLLARKSIASRELFTGAISDPPTVSDCQRALIAIAEGLRDRMRRHIDELAKIKPTFVGPWPEGLDLAKVDVGLRDASGALDILRERLRGGELVIDSTATLMEMIETMSNNVPRLERLLALQMPANDGLSPKAGVRAPTAEDRAMAAAMIAGTVAQVRREAELHNGTWPVPPSVRLVPQVPIRDQQAPRSWLGGRPRMQATMPWPEIEGTPCDFLAQIALADLPADLWHGLGPREGWLALFIHPESYSGHLLHVPELGPARDAPNPPAVPDGWYHPYGWHWGDAVQQRYMLRAFPQWPVDVVGIPAGEADQEEGARDDLSGAHYRDGFDVAHPAYHPFDWPGMLALVDTALKALEFRHGQAEKVLSPDVPSAAEALRMNLAAVTQVRQIATEVHEQAGRLPFAPQRAEALLTRLQTIHWMAISRRGAGADTIQTRVLPITVHDPDAALFAWDYHVLHFDMARHAYCRDIASLPVPTRARYEPLWRDLGMKRTPRLGGFPHGSVYDFSPQADVMVLEVPSNQLNGWMFGDVHDLVLMMTRDQIAACHFAEARYDVSN
jgi:hypothetical protein